LTYIEAMAAGVPVVAKADRCLEGVLLDGVNGFSFTDGEGLAQTLDRLLNDDIERERLSRGAQSTAKQFSAEVYADRVAYEYTRLFEKPHRRLA
jgi:1,2-diacylglycerol 3-alpha-glucosyltransferase